MMVTFMKDQELQKLDRMREVLVQGSIGLHSALDRVRTRFPLSLS
jgi:hypothetical protein